MLARWRLALNTWKVGLFCSTPRVRIKQHTGISNSYNNLNQLRNGLIPYDGHYPHYYDGLPLFKSPVDGTAEFKLKMNVTSSTSYSKLRIWIKEGEFENEATPCATCKSECPIIQDINKNTEIAITMPVEKNKYYFMKWTDLNGSTEVGYGGQITQLNELVFINEN